MCISVDLPEPDGPMIALKPPGGERDADAVERANLRLALAVDARQVLAATTISPAGSAGVGRLGEC